MRERGEARFIRRWQGPWNMVPSCTAAPTSQQACWDVGAAVQDGTMFHGPCHLRMNLASPRSRIEEAFRRMDQYVFNAK